LHAKNFLFNVFTTNKRTHTKADKLITE